MADKGGATGSGGSLLGTLLGGIFDVPAATAYMQKQQDRQQQKVASQTLMSQLYGGVEDPKTKVTFDTGRPGNVDTSGAPVVTPDQFGLLRQAAGPAFDAAMMQGLISRTFPAADTKEDFIPTDQGLYDVRKKALVPGTGKREEDFKVGATRDVLIGDQKHTQEYQGKGTWKDIGVGSAFAPKDPQAPVIQEFFDKDTGRPYKAQWINGQWVRQGGESTPSKTFNNDQNKAAGFANSMQQAEDRIANLGTGEKTKGSFKPYDPTGTLESLGGLSNVTASADYQKYKQAAMDWTLAVLRQESGANVPEAEASKYWKNFFPQYGDSAEVIKQKAEARATKMQGVSAAAGGAFEAIRSKSGTAPQLGVGETQNVGNVTIRRIK